MVKKLETLSADRKSGAELPIAAKDSAQQIWLAGLGAFAKAQAEGGKLFETLVKEGMSLQQKSQSDAEARLSDAATRISTLATDFSSRATGQWDKLENIFEQRVFKALKRLSVPSAADIDALSERIDLLTAEVRKLTASAAPQPRAKSGAPAASQPPLAPATRKTRAARKAP